MITFALFMIREIYCKLNSISGNTLSIERISDRIYSTAVKKLDLPDDERAFTNEILSEQQLCLPKAAKKLPSWTKNHCLFASIPLEQCTSESIAHAKASLFSGKNMLSLTGGLGVDDAAFSKKFEHITSLDPDKGLNAIARFNNLQMGIINITRLDTTAEDFLTTQNTQWDCIYADPDRRASGSRMAADVSAYSPDIFSLYKKFSHLAKNWIVKLSPMTDLNWFENQLGQPTAFYIFSDRSEVKELLAVWGENISPGVRIVHCEDNNTRIFGKEVPMELHETKTEIFCELSSAAIKAGFRDSIIEQAGLKAASRHGYYLIGNTIIPSALGRCFALNQKITGSLNHIGNQLKTAGITQANVSTRDFVMPSEETRKKLKLKDGGTLYLFFTGKDEKTCFVTEKLR
jgi:hypothetical protein